MVSDSRFSLLKTENFSEEFERSPGPLAGLGRPAATYSATCGRSTVCLNKKYLAPPLTFLSGAATGKAMQMIYLS